MLAMEKKTHQKTLANLLRIMLKNNLIQGNTKSNRKNEVFSTQFLSPVPLGS